jgi:hypothetical protein
VAEPGSVGPDVVGSWFNPRPKAQDQRPKSPMSIFIESPMPIIFVGIVAEPILGVLLVVTRRGVILWAMLAMLGVVAAGLAVERMVVTDEKLVKATLYGARDAIKANSLERLDPYLAPDAQSVRQQAAGHLRDFQFEAIRISGLQIDFNRQTSPPSAEARFNVLVQAKDRTGQIPYHAAALFMTVELRKIGERWLVTDRYSYEFDQAAFGHGGRRAGE